jgi:capsular polysaccharide biosynthesis protein
MHEEPRLLDSALRRWWVVLIAFLITTALTIMWVSPKPSEYKSSGTYVVQPRSDSNDPNGSSLRGSEVLGRGTSINATYALIARSDAIQNEAEARLPSIPKDAHPSIEAEAVTGTNAVTISSKARDAKTAHALAVAAGTETIAKIEALQQPFILAPLDPPEVPSGPVDSRKPLTIALGALLGLIVGLALAALLDRVAYLRRSQQQVNPVPAFPVGPAFSTSTASVSGLQARAVPPAAAATPRPAPPAEVLPAAGDPAIDVVIADATSNDSVREELARAADVAVTYCLGIFRVELSKVPTNGHHNGANGDGNGRNANGYERKRGITRARRRSNRFAPLHEEAQRHGLNLTQVHDGLFAVVLPDMGAVNASQFLSDWLAKAPAIDADNPDAGLMMSMTVVEYTGRHDDAEPGITSG